MGPFTSTEAFRKSASSGYRPHQHLRARIEPDDPASAANETAVRIEFGIYASTGQLLVKEYESPRGEFRVFDFESLRGLDLESRLQQLSAWVVAAHARGERYGLRLTHTFIEPADGLPHRNRCLAALDEKSRFHGAHCAVQHRWQDGQRHPAPDPAAAATKQHLR